MCVSIAIKLSEYLTGLSMHSVSTFNKANVNSFKCDALFTQVYKVHSISPQAVRIVLVPGQMHTAPGWVFLHPDWCWLRPDGLISITIERFFFAMMDTGIFNSTIHSEQFSSYFSWKWVLHVSQNLLLNMKNKSFPLLLGKSLYMSNR